MKENKNGKQKISKLFYTLPLAKVGVSTKFTKNFVLEHNLHIGGIRKFFSVRTSAFVAGTRIN